MTHTRKPDGRHERHYTLKGGIPWPALGDGTEYTDALKRVRHRELTTETGTLQWVEWCHPDGTFMPDGDRVKAATKTKAERAIPGSWWAVVAWDGREEYREEPILARHPLANLEIE